MVRRGTVKSVVEALIPGNVKRDGSNVYIRQYGIKCNVCHKHSM